ncbi:hypothetical protein [Leyella stercorea]|uniref:hypothetical protein n=1 Tax=Leyella stercorea TaxID=363265 RepID=UPI003FEFD73D
MTKQSTAQEIKAYFEEVLKLSKDSKEFPVNLDDVWPLVFGRKQEAVRALKNDKLFVENIDFQPLRKDAQRSDNGQFNGGDKVTYMLSVPCLEFFIARKVRPVFEVYRQVFHKVASGEIAYPAPIYSKPCDMETTLKPFVDFSDVIYDRWERLFDLSDKSDKVMKEYQNWIITYRNFCYYTTQMIYLETMAKFDGNHFLKK